MPASATSVLGLSMLRVQVLQHLLFESGAMDSSPPWGDVSGSTKEINAAAVKWRQQCLQNPGENSCKNSWVDHTPTPLRIGSLKSPGHEYKESIDPEKAFTVDKGWIYFEPKISFQRKGKEHEGPASFHQVVLNALRFFILRIDFARRAYTSTRFHSKVPDFTVCKGTVENLTATEMSAEDVFFEVYGGTVAFVIKNMHLVTDLNYDFKLKMFPLMPCTGDKGWIKVLCTGDIRMAFGPDGTGSCSYDNLQVGIVSARSETLPEWMIKFSSPYLTDQLDLVPQVGKHALEEMCQQFRGQNDENFLDLPGLKKKFPGIESLKKRQEVIESQKQKPIEVDYSDTVCILVLTTISLSIAGCFSCCCFFIGYKRHKRHVEQAAGSTENQNETGYQGSGNWPQDAGQWQNAQNGYQSEWAQGSDQRY
eukprot:gnl/MRDRNA2_/MRDRNA2_36479_c0_seq1.p1 gnl/MRDRNA2_/MRDRNA2_36479_c0~~gnl/MRDRNA2_/MRDRNA2_36479_c0_seq1.p1  ORF type:complete len:422 (-),score=64.34 gnl/MRDRNA2_/MRDRNA2_36479_c0_seq1:119-1384(-)